MNENITRIGPNNTIVWDEYSIDEAIGKKQLNKKIEDETMLMHSVKVGDYDLAYKLIKMGADMSIGDRKNRTPLWLTTIYNRDKIAELLIKSGADMEESEGYNSPLYNAIKFDNNEVAQLLIKMGANPNLQNRDGQTPLHCAVFRENKVIVKLLLENGADKNVKNNIKTLPGQLLMEPVKNETPYELALKKGNREIINLFDEKPTVSKQKDTKKINDNKNELSEADLQKFYDYLINYNKVIEEKQKLNIFFQEYKQICEYNDYGFYKTKEDLFESVNDSSIIEEIVKNKYYDDYMQYEQKKDEKEDLIIENNNHVRKVTNTRTEIERLNRNIFDLESMDKISIFNVIKKKFGFLLGLCIPFLMYFLVFVAVYFNLIFLGIIFVFITLGCFSMLGEFFDEFKTKKSKIIYVLIWISNIAIPFGGKIIFDTPPDINIIILWVLAIISFTVPALMYIIERKNVSIELYDKSHKELEELKLQRKKLENRINKEKVEMNKKCDEIDTKVEKINKDISKIGDQKLDNEELQGVLEKLYNEKCRDLIQEQLIIVNRWNDFAEFRRNHYIRKYEEMILESDIINEIVRLTDENQNLNKIKINSKNYNNYGNESDYVKYIYNLIDEEDAEL